MNVRPSLRRTLVALIALLAIPTLIHANGPRQDGDLGKLGKEFERIVDKVGPSVVDIRIQEQTLEAPKEGRTAVVTRKTLFRCSGVIRTRTGQVMTLLRDGLPEAEAEEGDVILQITLHNDETYRGHLIAHDEATGIALLQIENAPKKLLKPVRFPRTTAKRANVGVKKGSMVVAIGGSASTHPFRVGWVTRVNRSVYRPPFYFPRAIQTDIPAEPGAVGGMLANTSGEMVGMLAFTYAPGQGAAPRRRGGVNAIQDPESDEEPLRPRANASVLAVPWDLLNQIASQLTHNGRVQRGSIGALLRPEDVIINMKIAVERVGLRVVKIVPDGPAAQAGLLQNDIVIQINDRPVRSKSDLDWFAELVEYGKAGDVHTLRVFRDTKEYRGERAISIKLGSRPSL